MVFKRLVLRERGRSEPKCRYWFRERTQQMLIPALRKLIARGAVLEGYVAQYELLEEQQMKPSEFELKLANLPESSLINGYLILEPIRTAQK